MNEAGYPVPQARKKHQLPYAIWTVDLIIKDTPGPGEDYLDKTQLTEEIMAKLRDLSAGLDVSIKSIVLQEG